MTIQSLPEPRLIAVPPVPVIVPKLATVPAPKISTPDAPANLGSGRRSRHW